MLRGKFIALNAHSRISKINNLNFHLMKLGKKEKIRPKASRRK